MKDEELKTWWPDLGAVVTELRQTDQPEVADLLVDAVRGWATSSEILGNIGILLRSHRALRLKLSHPAKKSWDAVMADVNRPYPLQRLIEWCMRLVKR